jgi:hypothetical protein
MDGSESPRPIVKNSGAMALKSGVMCGQPCEAQGNTKTCGPGACEGKKESHTPTGHDATRRAPDSASFVVRFFLQPAAQNLLPRTLARTVAGRAPRSGSTLSTIRKSATHATHL